VAADDDVASCCREARAGRYHRTSEKLVSWLKFATCRHATGTGTGAESCTT
jgi:hypothetical protein